MNLRRCIVCGRTAARIVLDACYACYHRWRRRQGLVPERPCGNCGRQAPVAGKGRCYACWNWLRRHGCDRPADRPLQRGFLAKGA